MKLHTRRMGSVQVSLERLADLDTPMPAPSLDVDADPMEKENEEDEIAEYKTWNPNFRTRNATYASANRIGTRRVLMNT